MKKLWHRNVRSLLLILLIVGALLLVIEGWLGTATVKMTGFYALAGFVSFIALILIALLIAKVIKRKDTYYDS
ncbi:MAG: hypothetical protein GDA45_03205 [Chromatiales bacterium]|nr:hypothetical protein [Chromatiales bacterium]